MHNNHRDQNRPTTKKIKNRDFITLEIKEWAKTHTEIAQTNIHSLTITKPDPYKSPKRKGASCTNTGISLPF